MLKWSGTFEDLKSFCAKDLQNHLSESPLLSSCERSHSIKLKNARLVLYKNTGTLQVKGAESKTLKAEIQSLIPGYGKTVNTKSSRNAADSTCIQDHDDLAENDAGGPANETAAPDQANGQPPQAQSDLKDVREEIAKNWKFLKSIPTGTNEGQSNKHLYDLRHENQALRSTVQSLKERYDKLQDERDSLSLTLQLTSKELYNIKPPAPQNPEVETVENPKQPGDTAWKTVGARRKAQGKLKPTKAKPTTRDSDQHTGDHQPREQEQKRPSGQVSPQNVTLTQNVTTFDAKCNNSFNAKCNNVVNAKCNNAKCNKLLRSTL